MVRDGGDVLIAVGMFMENVDKRRKDTENVKRKNKATKGGEGEGRKEKGRREGEGNVIRNIDR